MAKTGINADPQADEVPPSRPSGREAAFVLWPVALAAVVLAGMAWMWGDQCRSAVVADIGMVAIITGACMWIVAVHYEHAQTTYKDRAVAALFRPLAEPLTLVGGVMWAAASLSATPTSHWGWLALLGLVLMIVFGCLAFRASRKPSPIQEAEAAAALERGGSD